jgi:hypothetical protein
MTWAGDLAFREIMHSPDQLGEAEFSTRQARRGLRHEYHPRNILAHLRPSRCQKHKRFDASPPRFTFYYPTSEIESLTESMQVQWVFA